MAGVVARIVGFPAPAGELDLEFRHGEVVRISGRNGSGKTSLLRCLAGLPAPLRPRDVWVDAQLGGARDGQGGRHGDPARWRAQMLARAIGMVPQDARDGLVGLTVAGEHRFRGYPPPPDHQDVATLSSGEARRLALHLARGPLLLLDEPTEGLDAEGMALLRRRIADHDGCVVFVGHEDVLGDAAHRHVALDEGTDRPPWRLPASGPHVLDAPSQDVRRGNRLLRLPSVHLAAGLHVVAGPNGAGKSTLLACLAGLDGAPATVHGHPGRPGTDLRWLSPRAEDHLTRSRVADEVGGGLDGRRGDVRDEVGGDVGDELGGDVGGDLSDDRSGDLQWSLLDAAWLDRHPLRLSGGQRKRVALAKVLGRPAAAYLLDEPEAHLDDAGRAALQAIVARRIEQGSVVVVATHDPTIIAAAHSVVNLPVTGAAVPASPEAP